MANEDPAVPFYAERRHAAVHGEHIRIEGWRHRLQKRSPIFERSAEGNAPRSAEVRAKYDVYYLSRPDDDQDQFVVYRERQIQVAPASDNPYLRVRGDRRLQCVEPFPPGESRLESRHPVYSPSQEGPAVGMRGDTPPCGPALPLLPPAQRGSWQVRQPVAGALTAPSPPRLGFRSCSPGRRRSRCGSGSRFPVLPQPARPGRPSSR